MLENIRLSIQGIWSHKMRSFLTMLGIIIGIAAIISIVSTIKGTNEQIKQNLVGAGNNTVEIKLYQNDWEYEAAYNGLPQGVPIITDEIRESILEVDGVEKASLYLNRNYAEGIYYHNTSLNGGKIYGIDNQYFSTCGYQMQKGRGFVDADYKNFRKVAILDSAAYNSLFGGNDPIDQTIEIQGEPFTVIGVCEKSNTFKPVINSMEDYYNYMASSNDGGIIFIPDASWPIPYNYDEPQNLIIRAASTDEMSSAGRKCADLLNGYVTSSDVKYKASDLLEQAKNLQELSAATNQQLIWIASISLLVGGIGVMNIMLVSVTERTREIGLKKAIGARKRRILAQFLTEAAVLTSLGGIIGVAAGIVMAQVISKVSQTPSAISIPAIIFSVIFSMAIGILFGLLPSIKAANLNPIDALRHE
ncbi:MAG: ABC transporter permease [Frisingicoccus sp.]